MTLYFSSQSLDPIDSIGWLLSITVGSDTPFSLPRDRPWLLVGLNFGDFDEAAGISNYIDYIQFFGVTRPLGVLICIWKSLKHVPRSEERRVGKECLE